MEAVIFDLDGVLVDSMPTHVLAWQSAFANVAEITVTDRDIYLLEGMRGIELITKIFDKTVGDRSLAHKILEEKNRVFRSIRRSNPFEGAAEMVERISCPKAVVSGSAKEDVETILDEAFGDSTFSAIVTADDVSAGNPDPRAFLEASKRLGVNPRASLVVENAPLGAVAAGRAGMECYIALNNTPLNRDDFGKFQEEKIFETTALLAKVLEGICQ